jgi:hypothetical protein
MNAIFSEIDAWLIALLLAAAMLAGWGTGLWYGRRKSGEPCEKAEGKFTDASLAVLGLLLAFTFSLSLAKHDQRRLVLVADSNAIGDFYTCASLLAEPVRGKLQAQVRTYIEQRLALAEQRLDEPTIQKKLDEIRLMHNRMQELVDEGLKGQTSIAVPLVNTLNALTSSHAARLAAGRDRLPASIVFVLFTSSVISMTLLGIQQGLAAERHIAATIGFVVLVSLVVWVTLDLNQPHRGLITLSQEPLQQLLKGMGK